jgi:hypothetical protein
MKNGADDDKPKWYPTLLGVKPVQSANHMGLKCAVLTQINRNLNHQNEHAGARNEGVGI